MKSLPKEVWQYAILLIILFAIATIAVLVTLSYIGRQISGHELRVVTTLIWFTTIGFMFIAGAFGLWAIRFSAEAEGLRRISRFVDTFDYLSDGLFTVDKKGRITGSNPAARDMTGSRLAKHEPIDKIFRCLNDKDVETLLSTEEANEIERENTKDKANTLLRFRSQPSEGINLILVSDITTMNAKLEHSRRAAKLQLIGQISRGVAHDFNNLLCVMSGHASLLERLPTQSQEFKDSIDAIGESSNKGTKLAAHLLELSKPGIIGHPTDVAHKYVETAAQVLSDSLPVGWTIMSTIKNMPTVSLTGMQIEQIVLNLGHLCADSFTGAGILSVSCGKAVNDKGASDDKNYAAEINVTAECSKSDKNHSCTKESLAESGVILSVIGSMISESGGRLDCVKTSGSPHYRISLSKGSIVPAKEESDEISDELGSYLGSWTILHASNNKKNSPLNKRLAKLKVKVNEVNNISSALTYIEESEKLDSIVLDSQLCEKDTKGLLRAILKLRPNAGLVVLCANPDLESNGLSKEIIFVQERSSPNKILLSMIESKTLAERRT